MREILRKSCILRFSRPNRSRLPHTSGFNGKFSSNKITKSVDDFLNFKNVSKSFCFMSWCINNFCAVGALCMFSYF